MKKRIHTTLAALITINLLLSTLGCVTAASAKNAELVPDSSQAILTVVRITAGGMGTRLGDPAEYDIVVDGNKVETVAKNQRVKVLVPNGTHTLQVGRGKLNSETLNFTADSNELQFHAYIDGVRGTLYLIDFN
jgi:archaellum component FlaF (FlaF/FlaG flagellin family)